MTNSKSSEPDQHAGAVGATRRCYRGAWRAACWDGQVYSPNVLCQFQVHPTWRRRTRAQVLLVAGGIGITPMRALFETLDVAGSDLTLLYRAFTPADVVFSMCSPGFWSFPPTLGAVVCSCTRNRSRPVTSTFTSSPSSRPAPPTACTCCCSRKTSAAPCLNPVKHEFTLTSPEYKRFGGL